MKTFLALVALLLSLQGAALGAPEPAAGFEQLRQKSMQQLQQSDSVAAIESLNQTLLTLYLWSKDNFEPRQWPELMRELQAWPEQLQQRRRKLGAKAEPAIVSLEAAYALLLHDYARAHQLVAPLPETSLYPALLRTLLGEQDEAGSWRISLPRARELVKRWPRQELTWLLLAEAVLEQPAPEPELVREAQQAVSQSLRLNPTQLYARYQQGQLLFLQQREPDARRYFEQQVAISPVATEAVGNFYLWTSELEAAKAFYSLAIKQEPLALRVYHKLEQILLQTQPGEAIRLYLRALPASPVADTLYSRLRGLYDQASPEQIKAWLKQDLPAGSYYSQLVLGDLALNENDARSAEYWYRKALELEPGRTAAYLNLLVMQWARRDSAGMAKILERARAARLQDPELDYWRAVLAMQQDRLDEAIGLLEPLAREDGRARYTLAMAYRARKDYAKARELLASLIEQDPQNVAMILGLGDLYLEEGSLSEAEEVYRLAQRIAPHHAMVYFSLGNLYSRSERFDEAIEAFERAILIQPTDPDLRNNLGNVYLRLQRLDAAREQFEAIVGFRPDYAAAYYNLACVFARGQQKDLALAHLRRAFALDPTLREAARSDTDLDALRQDARFQELLK